jgi:hypothetical protein
MPVRRPDAGGGHITSWHPTSTLWEFTAVDVAREAHVLIDLAHETTASGPWTAARKLFGGSA